MTCVCQPLTFLFAGQDVDFVVSGTAMRYPFYPDICEGIYDLLVEDTDPNRREVLPKDPYDVFVFASGFQVSEKMGPIR